MGKAGCFFQTANSVGILEEIRCHLQITYCNSLYVFSARILQMASESLKNPDRIPVGRVAGLNVTNYLYDISLQKD